MRYYTEFLRADRAQECFGEQYHVEGWYVLDSTNPDVPNATRFFIAYARNNYIARKIVETLNNQNYRTRLAIRSALLQANTQPEGDLHDDLNPARSVIYACALMLIVYGTITLLVWRFG